MPKILVLGGTGFVGRSVCGLLARAGAFEVITVPSRHPARAKHLWVLPRVSVVAADVHDPAALAPLVAAHDVVVNLIAILHGTEAQFQRAHVEFPRRLAQACEAAGGRRLVHVSALGVDSARPSAYLRSKAQGEAVLTQAAPGLTIMRPSVVFGAHDRFLNLFARLSAIAPLIPLAGAQAQFQPVWVEDLALGITNALDRPASIGAVYECVGPDVLTLADLVRFAGRLSGHRRLVVPLPEALGRLQARVMEMLPGEPLMSRDNLLSMATPNIATGRLPTLADLGVQLHALAGVGPSYLAKDR